MRVLMLGPGLDVRGGISTVERLILSMLPPSTAASHVATMVEGSQVQKFWAFLKSIVLVERQLQRGVDVVHIHFASYSSSRRKMFLAQRVAASGAALIMHAHGGAYREYWQQLTEFEKRWTRATLLKADCLVVLGERWREFFCSIGVPHDRIVILSNAVGLPDSIPDRSIRPDVVFVYLGLIHEAKGAFALLDAVRRLDPVTRSRCRLVFAGNGAAEELRRRSVAYGIDKGIDVRQWLDATARDQLLERADSFVLPSRNEGMPMALLEAMAWGLAPICTPVGSIPEILKHERNGLLVETGSIDALAVALTRMVNDAPLRRALGAAARRTAELHTPEDYVSKLMDIYESASRRKRLGRV